MSAPLERLKTALADRYAIEREIGSGGMATVYLAEDLKHHRQVAIKVLRPELAAALGTDRFLREIEIAAQLRHPHILPLYDSGEADGFLYYVMPYVDGESLRDRLEREKQLAIDDALQVAREVADALSYAHSHGVIHRDIKPENILLESGHAVVADFGIARAVDAAGGDRLTETGIAVGTPAYMSPEQAGGEKDLDGRSDLYSLGCVLYEMLAGQPPFTGPTVESLVHQHLSAEPPNVTAIRPSVPGWVAAALERSLAKTPADRFNPVAQFGEAISPRTSVTASDSLPKPAPMGRRRWVAPGVLAAALVVVIAVVLYRMMEPKPLNITTSNAVRITSDPGLEWQPALSPNGSEVAYVARRGGGQSLVIKGTRNIAGGGELAPTRGFDESHDWFPTWSSDGEMVRFWSCPGRTSLVEGCAWREVAKLGGSVRSVDLPIHRWSCSWSPDDTQLACDVSPDSIFAYSIGDGSARLVAVHPSAQWSVHSPVWSPDERWIVYVAANRSWRSGFNVDASSIWVVDAESGEPLRVTGDDHMDASPAWLDSDHLLFLSNRDGMREVYVVELGPAGPRGEPRKVPGVTDAHSISYSRAGRKLAFSKATVRQNIWSYPTSLGPQSISDGHTVTSENAAIESHDISPDGEWIAYDSDLRGNQDIYKMAIEGGSPTPIIDSPLDDWAPRWSPDGSEIAFVRDLGSGEWAVMVAPADGGAAVQVVSDAVVWLPVWSPSGLDIAYWKAPASRTEVWVTSREAVGAPWGEPVRLTDFACYPTDWARDGSGVLCQAGSELVLVSREGEALWRYDLAAAGLQGGGRARFSWDGSMVYQYGSRDDGSRGMWAIPVQGGEPSLVVQYDQADVEGVSRYFSVAPDRLYLTVRESESDIWVMDLEW